MNPQHEEITTGDTIRVRAGPSKGKTGKVLRLVPLDDYINVLVTFTDQTADYCNLRDLDKVVAAAGNNQRDREEMSTRYIDRKLTCADCEQEFIWLGGEQEFFIKQGFADPPELCKDCRQAKRRADLRVNGIERRAALPSPASNPQRRASDLPHKGNNQ